MEYKKTVLISFIFAENPVKLLTYTHLSMSSHIIINISFGFIAFTSAFIPICLILLLILITVDF